MCCCFCFFSLPLSLFKMKSKDGMKDFYRSYLWWPFTQPTSARFQPCCISLEEAACTQCSQMLFEKLPFQKTKYNKHSTLTKSTPFNDAKPHNQSSASFTVYPTSNLICDVCRLPFLPGQVRHTPCLKRNSRARFRYVVSKKTLTSSSFLPSFLPSSLLNNLCPSQPLSS